MPCRHSIIAIQVCPEPFLNQKVHIASIIADGIHVHYSAVSIAKKIMKERLFLVSDAVEENIEGKHILIIKDRKDIFTLPDGTLSGSILTMMTAVRNCVENAEILSMSPEDGFGLILQK